MDDATGRAYLARLGVGDDERLEPDAATLRRLHRAHQESVPFENLSIHLGEPIVLDEAALVDKLVNQGRGGFCYELNGAFASLAEWLGFGVRRAAAAVHGGAGLGPPFDHLALLVDPVDDSGTWLADVGFGAHSTYPLRLELDVEQPDPGGRFMLMTVGVDDIEVHKDSEPQYRLERRPRSLTDFVPTCWWQQSSPDSHFTRSTICSRLTADGRVSVSGNLLIRTSGETRTEEPLPDDAAVLEAYRRELGVTLDRVPVVKHP